MKVFFSYSHKDIELVNRIADRIRELNHDVFVASQDVQVGVDWNKAIKENLSNSDVLIPVITPESVRSNWLIFEIGSFSEYVNQSDGKKTIIPIVFENADIPTPIEQFTYITALTEKLDEVIDKIQYALSQFEARLESTQRKQLEYEELLEVSAADYVDETLKTLRTREKSLKRQADIWYFIGFVSLLLGASLAFYITLIGYNQEGDWIDFALLGVKAAIMIILLIAASKYSFNLGKTFMTESLKNSDRIHAISFGKFFLQVFGRDIKKNEIREVFKEWNLESNSKFSELSANDYDPKLLELISKVIETVQSKNK